MRASASDATAAHYCSLCASFGHAMAACPSRCKTGIPLVLQEAVKSAQGGRAGIDDVTTTTFESKWRTDREAQLKGGSAQLYADAQRSPDIPDALRCMDCGLLAVHAVWAPCCDVVLCGPCRDSRGPFGTTPCPVCGSLASVSEDTFVATEVVRTRCNLWLLDTMVSLDHQQGIHVDECIVADIRSTLTRNLFCVGCNSDVLPLAPFPPRYCIGCQAAVCAACAPPACIVGQCKKWSSLETCPACQARTTPCCLLAALS